MTNPYQTKTTDATGKEEPTPTDGHRSPGSGETPPNRHGTSTQRVRRWSVWILYGSAALWGCIQVVMPNSGAVQTLMMGAVSIVATTWAMSDAKLLSRSIPSIAWVLFLATWPLAVLIYLIWTRGIAGIGYWVIHFVGLNFVTALFFYATFYLLFSLDMIDLNEFGLVE